MKAKHEPDIGAAVGIAISIAIKDHQERYHGGAPWLTPDDVVKVSVTLAANLGIAVASHKGDAFLTELGRTVSILMEYVNFKRIASSLVEGGPQPPVDDPPDEAGSVH